MTGDHESRRHLDDGTVTNFEEVQHGVAIGRSIGVGIVHADRIGAEPEKATLETWGECSFNFEGTH